jgi:hypothetical protein
MGDRLVLVQPLQLSGRSWGHRGKWIKWAFDSFFAPQLNPPYGRQFMLRGLVSSLIMAIFLIACLIVLNNPAFLPDNGSELMPNAVLGVFLVGICYCCGTAC